MTVALGKSGIPNLKVFMQRQKIIAMYREFLKEVRFLRKLKTEEQSEHFYYMNLSAELEAQIKTDFRKNSTLESNLSVKAAINDANRNLLRLKEIYSSGKFHHDLSLHTFFIYQFDKTNSFSRRKCKHIKNTQFINVRHTHRRRLLDQ